MLLFPVLTVLSVEEWDEAEPSGNCRTKNDMCIAYLSMDHSHSQPTVAGTLSSVWPRRISYNSSLVFLTSLEASSSVLKNWTLRPPHRYIHVVQETNPVISIEPPRDILLTSLKSQNFLWLVHATQRTRFRNSPVKHDTVEERNNIDRGQPSVCMLTRQHWECTPSCLHLFTKHASESMINLTAK